jgi:hypothetical protein
VKKLLLLLLVLFCTLFCVKVSFAGEYFMPTFWMASHGEPILFKDIGGNQCLIGEHDSVEFIFSRPVCTDEGVVGSAFRWEWVYRSSTFADPIPNRIYQRISINSVIAEESGYLVVKKDIYNNKDGFIWSPHKKISKLNWDLGDPITQRVIEYSTIDANYCSEGIKEAVVAGQNTWELIEVMDTLKNQFWDGTSKTWTGTILRLEENEPNQNKADYWLLFGKGLIRIRMTTPEGYIWMESGAY